jgi:hypothetical protein
MKRTLLLIAVLSLVWVGETFAQFPLKTIREIQEVTDLDSPPPADASPLLNDTVVVRGVVATPVRYNGGPHLWYTGDRLRFVLKDPTDSVFNYITVVAVDSAYFTSLGMDLLVEGDSIEVKGKITEYRSLTQFEVLKVDDCYSLLGTSTADLSSATKPLTDFVNGTVTTRNPSEKYESGFIRLTNLTVIGVAGQEFTVADANGNQITVDDQSNQVFSMTPPPPGSQISFVQGYMFTNSASAWTINPRTGADFSVAFAPSITAIVRQDTFPTSASTVTMKAKITTKSSTITSADLYYSVDGLFAGKLAMTSSDSIYSVVIPATGKDSALVSFYIRAENGDSKVSVSPADTINDRHFYLTLNRPVTVRDVQFSPFKKGSSYNANYVTVTGIITADRLDYGAIYLQNGTGPWSGIRIIARDSKDTVIRRGDALTVRGFVREQFDLTVLDTISFTVNSSNNPLPAPSKVKAADVKTGGSQAEAYESVLIKVDSVYVVNLNEDAISNSNFGEFGLLEDNTKTSGLRVDDFSNKIPFTNDTVRTTRRPITQLKLKDYFSSVIGPLDYSFNNFKMLPRDSADFVGYTAVTSVRRSDNRVPSHFVLGQNYPNPFNPVTTIKYSLPTASPVVLKVYNIVGQEVATVVNAVQSAGNYAVSFDASRLATGVYLYKLQTGSFTAVKKMMLLK